jgi:hypothetical protein
MRIRGLPGEAMKAHGVDSPRSLYFSLGDFRNAEHPRLWPWVCQTHRDSPPERTGLISLQGTGAVGLPSGESSLGGALETP